MWRLWRLRGWKQKTIWSHSVSMTTSVLVPLKFGKDSERAQPSGKTTGLPERHNRPLLHGMSSLGIIAHLHWDRWRLKERNLLCYHFSIIHINTWEQRYGLQRMKGNKKHLYLILECICTYICLGDMSIP